MVTGKKAGIVTITAYGKKNSVIGSYSITVVEPSIDDVKSFFLRENY